MSLLSCSLNEEVSLFRRIGIFRNLEHGYCLDLYEIETLRPGRSVRARGLLVQAARSVSPLESPLFGYPSVLVPGRGVKFKSELALARQSNCSGRGLGLGRVPGQMVYRMG